MEGRWLGRKILATRALQVAGDLTRVLKKLWDV